MAKKLSDPDYKIKGIAYNTVIFLWMTGYGYGERKVESLWH